MIALMTINQPEQEVRNRTTLVVVPAALLSVQRRLWAGRYLTCE
jgi:hypothetical protein